MSAFTKFLAIVPQTVQSGDKIRLKGRVKPDAIKLIIDFANEPTANPSNITYHFEWIRPENIILQAEKINGNWQSYEEDEDKTMNVPDFALEFAFLDDEIYVYLIHNDGHNLLVSFSPNTYSLSDIKSIQVLGDVEAITELNFTY